jgi:threonine/homoserine/homoserine lactone efflux protein
VLADKILFPDRYSRVDSLAMHGRRAAEIAVGAVLMFFVAAILEGVFRQLVASTPWRFTIGALTGVGWLLYFTWPLLMRVRDSRRAAVRSGPSAGIAGTPVT